MQRLGLDVSTITLEDPKRGEQEMQGMGEKQSAHVHLQAMKQRLIFSQKHTVTISDQRRRVKGTERMQVPLPCFPLFSLALPLSCQSHQDLIGSSAISQPRTLLPKDSDTRPVNTQSTAERKDGGGKGKEERKKG